MEKTKNTEQNTELSPMPMTRTVTLKGPTKPWWQLRLEFPNYPEWWEDWNGDWTHEELMASLEKKMKAFRKRVDK